MILLAVGGCAHRGIQDGTFIQITKGLNEGEEIVTGPYELLSKDLANSDKIKLEEKK